VFETREDVRYFLALLALEVRAGRLEVLAFAFLTTHFHLLVRSRTGELDRVMQRVLNLYVRYFNRTRRRDGPLFRGRYCARAVRSERYLHTLVRYIDQNAPQARLASTATEYPHGSAVHYVSARRPPWLATEYVDGLLGDPPPHARREAYVRCFGSVLLADEAEVVDRRLERASTLDDDGDDLLHAAPARVLEWMRRKARLADGTKPGLPYAGARRVLQVVGEAQARGDLPNCRPAGENRRDAWPVMRVGLLRDLAGMTHAEISRTVGCTPSMAARRVEQHARLLAADEAYAQLASTLAARCLAARM
jgi:hypothetical protein